MSSESYSRPVSSVGATGREMELSGNWRKSISSIATPTGYGAEAPNVTEAPAAGPQVFSWEGCVLSASSSIFWTLLALTVKLSPATAMAKLLFHVSVGVFVGIMTCMGGVSVPYGALNAQFALFFRSILVVTSLFTRLFALRYLTLVDSFVLSSVSPMLFLGSQCITRGRSSMIFVQLLPMSMTIAAFCMVVLSNLVYRTGQGEDTGLFSLGFGLSITSSVLRAITRYFADLTSGIPKAVLIFHWSLVALFASCCMAASLDRPWQLFDEHDMGVMVFIAKISFASVYFLDKARDLESYAMTNIFLYVIDLAVSCAMAKLLLGEATGTLSYAAAGLVAVSVIISEISGLIEEAKIKQEEGAWSRAF
ncbi:uncharacterized protein LOC135400974 [Ornithodoros turicata]|uniref:uncharacterized protein LOC135400974 n=1 Tax=Ornithodoros turicata TaxID=34597 RepID=UPI00313A0BF2